MKFNWLIALLILSVVFSSCKKNKTAPPLQVKLSYKVDDKPLLFDTLIYHTSTGYLYNVTRINYYLSDFVFTMKGGTELRNDSVYYIDAKQPSFNLLAFGKIFSGACKQVSFKLGIDSVRNITDNLSPTVDNINMGWPDMMGGGYHFMKLEGHYVDSAGAHGFAIHLGKNKNLVTIHLNNPVIAESNNNLTLNLTMNINEWFRNPENYDFNIDGSYSMNNDAAMQKLCANATDIFN